MKKLLSVFLIVAFLSSSCAVLDGAGIVNRLPKYTEDYAIGLSSITDNGTHVTIPNLIVTGTSNTTSSHVQNTDWILTTNGTTQLINSGNLTSDLRTDRWLKNDTNTFFGVDVAGLGVLTHTGGQEGWYNTLYGNNAGRNTTTGYKNTFIGESAGYRTTTGFYNTFIGADVGSFTTTGQYNTALGYQSFALNTLGSYNTAIGLGALASMDSGNYNTAVGLQSLNANTTGSYNTALGLWAGKNNTGSYNVFIGKSAGENSGSESHMLYIDNTSTATPLISGNFTSNTVTINDTLNMAGNIVMVPGATVDGVDISTLAGGSGNVTTVGGTANKISKFTGSASIGNSSITDNGTWVVTTSNVSTSNLTATSVNSTGNMFISGNTTMPSSGYMISPKINENVAMSVNSTYLNLVDDDDFIDKIGSRRYWSTFVPYGTSTTVTGTGGSDIQAWLTSCSTGAAANSTAGRYLMCGGLAGVDAGSSNRFDWDKDYTIYFKLRHVDPTANTKGYFQIKESTNIAVPLGELGLGFYISNNNMYGESWGSAGINNGNGTDAVNLGTTLASQTTTNVIMSKVGTNVYWYIDGVLKGSQTTANKVPTGDGAATGYLVISNLNGATAAEYQFRTSLIKISIGK